MYKISKEIITNMSFLRGVSLITIIGFIARAHGLTSQPLSGDDVSVALSAVNYIDTGHMGPTMWNHPNLRNITVYFFLWLFGGGILGLKAASLIFGSLSIPILALLARRLTGSSGVAFLASFLLAIDSLHIDFSRQAIQSVYMPFFSLLAIYLAILYLDKEKPLIAICSGIFFGLGLSAKWSVIFPQVATYFFLFYHIKQKRRDVISDKISGIIFLSAALIIIPLTIYILTFIPWFQRGHTFFEWLYLQQAMYMETVSHAGYNPYDLEVDHRAYLWFVKPVAYVVVVLSQEMPRFLVGISNPMVWLLTLPAIVYLINVAKKESIAEYYFLSALFWFSYLPFVLTSRPIWAHTAFSVLPFALIAVAFLLLDWTKKIGKSGFALPIYIAMVIVCAIPLYLLSVGKGNDIYFLRPIVNMYKPSDEVFQLMLDPNMKTKNIGKNSLHDGS